MRVFFIQAHELTSADIEVSVYFYASANAYVSSSSNICFTQDIQRVEFK
jgi:hypothetical protein